MGNLSKGKLIAIGFSLFSVAACNNKATEEKYWREKPIVILQPLHSFSTETLTYLKDTIEKFYPVNIAIADTKNFPANFYYKPRNRYRADSTIKWLKQIKPDSVRSIV